MVELGSDSPSLKIPLSYFSLLRCETEKKGLMCTKIRRMLFALVWGLWNSWLLIGIFGVVWYLSRYNKWCTSFSANTKLLISVVFSRDLGRFWKLGGVHSTEFSVLFFFCSNCLIGAAGVFQNQLLPTSRNSPPSKQRKFLQSQSITSFHLHFLLASDKHPRKNFQNVFGFVFFPCVSLLVVKLGYHFCLWK